MDPPSPTLEPQPSPRALASPQASSSTGPRPTSAAAGSTQDAEHVACLKKRIASDLQEKTGALDTFIHDYAVAESKYWNGKDRVTEPFLKWLEEGRGRKRLFVCCDGTWMNSSGSVNPLSNVARLARSVDRYGIYRGATSRAIPQVTYYSDGVGSQSVLPFGSDSLYAAATGEGLEDDILGAYCFLCNNFNFASRKDEIILVGFSRGAFTVRCLADFISQVGLLRRVNLPFLRQLFEAWAQEGSEDTREGFEKRISNIKKLSYQADISVLAEWDTVSALWGRKFAFDYRTVPAKVRHAFFALALHEKRRSFSPIPWMWARENQEVKQCAFTGCHGDVGGGNHDAGLSTVSLLWMVANIEKAVGADHDVFDEDALLQTMLPHKASSTVMNLTISEGKYHESLEGWWSVPYHLGLGIFHKGRAKSIEPYGISSGPQDVPATMQRCLLKVHFTVRLLQPPDYPHPRPVRKGKTFRMMKLFRRKRLLVPLEPVSSNERTWKFIDGTLEEDAVSSIEKRYWNNWRQEATKWCRPDSRDDRAKENVKYWEKVCKGLNYTLQKNGAQALVLRIFDLDRIAPPSCLTEE